MLSSLGDIVGFVAFTLTVVVLIATPSSEHGTLNGTTKVAMIAAFAVYVIATGENLLDAAGMSSDLLDEVESYVEILFPVLVLLAMSSGNSALQIQEIQRTQRAMQASQALTSEIIDRTPAGILLLDQVGNVVFANDAACDILDLREDSVTGEVILADWTVKCAGGAGRPDLSELPAHDYGPPVECDFVWSSGWEVELNISVQRMGSSEDGVPTGFVATFERPYSGNGNVVGRSSAGRLPT